MQQYSVSCYQLDSLEVEDLGVDNPSMEEEGIMVGKTVAILTTEDRATVSGRFLQKFEEIQKSPELKIKRHFKNNLSIEMKI